MDWGRFHSPQYSWMYLVGKIIRVVLPSIQYIHNSIPDYTLCNASGNETIYQIDKCVIQMKSQCIVVWCLFKIKMTIIAFLEGGVRETCPCRKIICIRDLSCWRGGGSTTEETRWSVVQSIPETARRGHTQFAGGKNEIKCTYMYRDFFSIWRCRFTSIRIPL